MKVVNYEIEVIEKNCTGCYLCERICPTGAIVMEGPKSAAIAVVDNDKCVACFRCVDICEDDALLAPERATPVTFGIDPASVDQVALANLLRRANLHPDETSCVCTMTPNKEIAAAVISGAKTLEEVALRTGTQSGCLMYCFSPIHRLVTEHWGEMPESSTKNKWYPSSLTLMDVPDEVCDRHPEFQLKQEKQNFVNAMDKTLAHYTNKPKTSAPETPASGK